MKSEYLNIYNNLIKLTRNKNLYSSLKNNDTFSDRLMIFLFHLAFFLKNYKSKIDPKYMQNFYDYTFKQIELDIREIFSSFPPVNINHKPGPCMKIAVPLRDVPVEASFTTCFVFLHTQLNAR